MATKKVSTCDNIIRVLFIHYNEHTYNISYSDSCAATSRQAICLIYFASQKANECFLIIILNRRIVIIHINISRSLATSVILLRQIMNIIRLKKKNIDHVFIMYLKFLKFKPEEELQYFYKE